MLTLLVFGSLGFWIYMGVMFLLLILFTEFEKPGWGALSIAASVLLLYLLGDINVFSWVYHNPVRFSVSVLCYLAIGTVWGVVKWYFFVHRKKEEYLEAKDEYEKSPAYANKWATHNGPYGQEDIEEKTNNPIPWSNSTKRSWFLNSEKGIHPLPKDNKNRILMWMGYWPWSCFWTVINDPLKKAFKAIYTRIAGRLLKVSQRAFADVA